MQCPVCGYQKSSVIHTSSLDDHQIIRRNRKCKKCNVNFTTYEIADYYFGELQDCKIAIKKIKKLIGEEI